MFISAPYKPVKELFLKGAESEEIKMLWDDKK